MGDAGNGSGGGGGGGGGGGTVVQYRESASVQAELIESFETGAVLLL